MTEETVASGAGTVLVVDDDENVRQSLIDVMATAGVRGVGASGRAEALAAQLRYEPSVVVVDYRLPDCSGIELARELKEHDAEVPVLLLTGYASLDTAVAAVGQLDAYLIKPVAPHAFLQTIRNALARRGLVAENRSLVERLQRLNAYQALYDPLTGLPNRALLDDRLSQALAAARRTGTALAVLFVDLDRFKVVNDLFGHHVGDQLLREMADRLAIARRRSDTVARFGGDEFVVVCPDVSSSASACRIAEHLLAELARPAMVEGVEHRLTASIGITITGPGALSQSPEALLRNADTAMYRAKEGGRADWELFDEAMRDRVVERFEVERGLRAGMERGDLVLAYQPMVELGGGKVVGAEALLRWHRAGHGTILPGSFLPVAEESGLITPIGRWVLETGLSEPRRGSGPGWCPRTSACGSTSLPTSWPIPDSPRRSVTFWCATTCRRQCSASRSSKMPCETLALPARSCASCGNWVCRSTSTTSVPGIRTCRGSRSFPSPGSRSTVASWPPWTSPARCGVPPSSRVSSASVTPWGFP